MNILEKVMHKHIHTQKYIDTQDIYNDSIQIPNLALYKFKHCLLFNNPTMGFVNSMGFVKLNCSI